MIMTMMNGMMRMITRRLRVMIIVTIMMMMKMKTMRMINNIMMRMSRVRIIETR